MNKERRKATEAVRKTLEAAVIELERLRGLEQSAFNNLTKNLQATDRGQDIEGNADQLDVAAYNLKEMVLPEFDSIR